jgi:hypothetical protein
VCICRFATGERAAAHGTRHKVDRDHYWNSETSFRHIGSPRRLPGGDHVRRARGLAGGLVSGVRARRAGRSVANRYLLDDIKRVDRDTCGRCGSPRIHEELKSPGAAAEPWPHRAIDAPARSRQRLAHIFIYRDMIMERMLSEWPYKLKAIPEETSTPGHRRENTPKPTSIRPDFISEVNH